MRWMWYCGPPLGAYRAFVRLHDDVELELDPGTRPVPSCIAPGTEYEGVVHGDWLEHAK